MARSIASALEDADVLEHGRCPGEQLIGVQNGTIQVPSPTSLRVKRTSSASFKAQDLIMELKSGKLDVVYIDYTAALAFAAANDDLTVKDIGIESDSEGQCIGVQKGNEDFAAT